jgi:hypothetical protein
MGSEATEADAEQTAEWYRAVAEAAGLTCRGTDLEGTDQGAEIWDDGDAPTDCDTDVNSAVADFIFCRWCDDAKPADVAQDLRKRFGW